MSISDRIRALARAGRTTSEIAAELGIRYQHAYTVLRTAALLQPRRHGMHKVRATVPAASRGEKALLDVETLVRGGFRRVAEWSLAPDGRLALSGDLPASAGVYAFVISDVVKYVGVATVGLAKRLYFYTRPGPRQITNQRLNGIILERLVAGERVELYVATPPDLEWNGLPVHGGAGLELGLIKRYRLEWNSRSAG